MKVDLTNAGTVSGFYVVGIDVFDLTRAESKILQTFDLTSSLLHYGIRHGQVIWLLENRLAPSACCIWVEEGGQDGAADDIAVH